jgi:lipopolysaccharide export system protein LptA
MNQPTNTQKLGIKNAVNARKRWSYILFFLLMLGCYAVAHAEEKTKAAFIADQLESDVINDEPCTRLAGNVAFSLEKCTIEADSAIYYDKREVIEAQGRVRIVHEDGSVIVADQLIYEEGKQLAKLRGKVVYESGTTRFYTDHFDYNTATKKGYFAQGGTLVDGDNVLVSDSGHYNDITKKATFKQNVEFANKDYTVQCDKLHYNTVTKIAKFDGKTQIFSRDGKQALTTEDGGEYNTSNQSASFVRSVVQTPDYVLYGDMLKADKEQEAYAATGNVQLVAREDDVIIYGDYGTYNKKEGVAEVYGNALMAKTLDDDTLYLSADKFVATEKKGTEKKNDGIVRAYHNVKLYKKDFQGKADSMVYQGEDATIYFYGDPIFWSNESQLTADGVQILLKDKEFDEMHMKPNAFVALQDVLENFNQLQGRGMVAYFVKNKIDHIDIDGNAESIYYVVGDDKKLQGMNHLKCSQMFITMEKDQIAGIKFNTKPVGAFYPPHKMEEGPKQLTNFNWRGDERPTRQEVVEHGYGMNEAYEKFKFNEKP